LVYYSLATIESRLESNKIKLLEDKKGLPIYETVLIADKRIALDSIKNSAVYGSPISRSIDTKLAKLLSCEAYRSCQPYSRVGMAARRLHLY
jgi:hypothetical protein